MKKTILLPSAAILAMCIFMTSCSQPATEEVPASLPEESVIETTAEPLEPIEITEDYEGAVLGVENWHMETEDLSWGSVAYINIYLIDDDTGKAFAAFGGLADEVCAFLTDLNSDGGYEVVCNTNMGTTSEMLSYTCIFRLNDGVIEIAYPCYGDLENSSFNTMYPTVAKKLDLDINSLNCNDYCDKYDFGTDKILLVDLVNNAEYEITYDCLDFCPYALPDTDETGQTEQTPSDEIDIIYETADPVITDISDTVKQITFYRNGMEIEGKLYLPEGDGPFPVIVLSCGLMQPYEDYEADAQGFADSGYAAVVFSFIDYSDPNGEQPSDYGAVFLSETADLYAVMDSLDSLPGIDTDNVYLWGHSLGGLIAAFAGCNRGSEVKGMLLVEPAIVIGEELAVTYEDGTCETLRIYDLLADCDLNTVIYMGTHDGYGEDPTSFDQVLEVLPSGELVIVEGADHFFEGEYGEMMVEDACEKIASW